MLHLVKLFASADFPPKRGLNTIEVCYETLPDGYNAPLPAVLARLLERTWGYGQRLRPPDDEALHEIDAHAPRGIQ